MASIKITDMRGREVTGCCSFAFNGFRISVSNVFPNASDRVLVTDEHDKDVFACFTVDEAVAWIDAPIASEQVAA
jgi:hypothetical protein